MHLGVLPDLDFFFQDNPPSPVKPSSLAGASSLGRSTLVLA